MRLSEYIGLLQKLLQEHGDLPMRKVYQPLPGGLVVEHWAIMQDDVEGPLDHDDPRIKALAG